MIYDEESIKKLCNDAEWGIRTFRFSDSIYEGTQNDMDPPKSLLEQKDDKGDTPLIWAVNNYKFELVVRLLFVCANVHDPLVMYVACNNVYISARIPCSEAMHMRSLHMHSLLRAYGAKEPIYDIELSTEITRKIPDVSISIGEAISAIDSSMPTVDSHTWDDLLNKVSSSSPKTFDLLPIKNLINKK